MWSPSICRAPDIWSRLLGTSRRYGGPLHLPVAGRRRREATPDRAGADLLHELPGVADWLAGIDGRLVLGNYVYADGATNVRVSMAVDTLTARAAGRGRTTALAFLATPTDTFAVPGRSGRAGGPRLTTRRDFGRVRRPLRMVCGGPAAAAQLPARRRPRHLRQPGAAAGPELRAGQAAAAVARDRGPRGRHDGVVSRWRRRPVPVRCVKNRALAAAYAGAHRFGVEVFEPATSNTLMAVLLVHDLHSGAGRPQEHPWQDEAYGAAHGGLWRAPYAPRSALGLAALLGLGAPGLTSPWALSLRGRSRGPIPAVRAR